MLDKGTEYILLLEFGPEISGVISNLLQLLVQFLMLPFTVSIPLAKMKTNLFLLIILISVQSCIPIRIAPNIEDYKVTKGKKFKRSLPKREMFVFEDPKEINHFYHYVDTKFQLNNENVYDDVPFKINGQHYFFSFYEVEIPTKIINLGGVLVDAMLDNAGVDPVFEESYGTRNGHWYIAMEVYSDIEKDCLQSGALSRELVLKYLRALKQEYLTTHNYNETVFKN